MKKEYEAEEEPLEKGKKKKKKKRLLTVLIVILAVLVALLGIIYALFHHYYAKTNYLKDSAVSMLSEDQLPEDVLNENGLSSMSEEARRRAEESFRAAQDLEFANGDYVYNLLLIGSDRRDDSWYGNSDVMMLASINKKIGRASCRERV